MISPNTVIFRVLLLRLLSSRVPIVALVRARDVAWQTVESKSWHIVRPFAPKRWARYHELIRCISLEAEFVEGLLLKLSFALRLLLLREQKLIEPKRVDRLHLLLENLGDWVALALQEVDKVHDLLFPQLKVGDFVLQWLQQALQVHILSDEHIEIFDQLIILFLKLIALHLHFFVVRSRYNLSQRLI